VSGGDPVSLVVENIGELTTHGPLGTVLDAALVVVDGRVAWVGPTSQAPAADRRIDARGLAVIPGFVDSHAHLVFAGDRSAEFAARMAGQPYTAGGIQTTVAATRAASDSTPPQPASPGWSPRRAATAPPRSRSRAATG